MSRIYDEDFPYASNVLDKESLFIPTGFDNQELIDQTDLRAFFEIFHNMLKEEKE